MLKFYQNGKWDEIWEICGNGYAGQIVILGQPVDWGKNPDPVKKPLSKYSYLSIFTIVEKKYGDDGYYTLRDSSGNIIKVNFCDACYLYDSQEWVKWKERNSMEYKNLSEVNIKCLEEKVELLKGILVEQGIRIVTQEQASILGL